MTNAAMPDPEATLMSQSDSTYDTVEAIVMALSSAIEAKDFRIRRHSERVAKYTAQLGEKLNLSPGDSAALHYGALLHDIGNIGIADSILLKPGGLSDWEFEEVRMHPIIGEQICKPLVTLAPLLPLVRSHHEKLNGSGYPDGLKGDEIPLLVRVLCVADVYDTLRSDRAYRGAFGHEQAIEILQEEVTRGWWQQDIVDMMADISAPQGDFAPV
jgi:putative two-component system response regulator